MLFSEPQKVKLFGKKHSNILAILSGWFRNRSDWVDVAQLGTAARSYPRAKHTVGFKVHRATREAKHA